MIGKTRLFEALERMGENPFSVEWHPFQLNPEMPASGMDRREYLETKFGGQMQAVKVYSQIDEAAQAAGLSMNLGGIKRTPNTLDAHRLIHWAGLEGVQTTVVDKLFKAYFMEGRDISEHSVLLRIAEAAGLDADAIKALLEGDADKEDIKARDANARHRGVSGVPCFIVDNQYVVQGAQGADVWMNVIEEITQKDRDTI